MKNTVQGLQILFGLFQFTQNSAVIHMNNPGIHRTQNQKITGAISNQDNKKIRAPTIKIASITVIKVLREELSFSIFLVVVCDFSLFFLILFSFLEKVSVSIVECSRIAEFQAFSGGIYSNVQSSCVQ